VSREGKSVGGCCGPDYDDWMTRKDEYLNEQIDLTSVGIWHTEGQETDCGGKRLTAVSSEGWK